MAEHAVSEMIQSLGRRYVRYINKEYNRTGTLWEGRFKSSLIDSEKYLLTCMQYIEMNPVRATMVEHPADYPWSSYQFNAQGKISKLLEGHPVYTGLSDTTEERVMVCHICIFGVRVKTHRHEGMINIYWYVYQIVIMERYYGEITKDLLTRNTSTCSSAR